MSENITKKIIREKLPQAKFARFNHKKSVVADAAATATPTSQEMLAKWSNSRFLRSYAGVESDIVEAATADTDDADAYDAEVVIIDIQAQDTPVPESLRRRTLVVDKKKGKIVAESG